ncbi:MAG: PKD domain-containing protein [Chloroflexi bacterium]|nr:PKD domain-containing protein [Chloroflexota bacterium]
MAKNKNGVQAGIDAYPWTRPDGWFDIQPIVAPIDPLLIGSNVPASAHFVDLDASTTHTAIWDWGDGTQSAGLVSEAGGIGDVTGSHVYNTTGVFEVRLTMTDGPFLSEVQEVFQYVVIYDPTAGFVTGGGWIISPLGAYVPDPTLTGHATFGFISKYYRTKTSGSELGGSTVFEFHTAGMRFKSSTYDWLVVNSNKAMFKGQGHVQRLGLYQR